MRKLMCVFVTLAALLVSSLSLADGWSEIRKDPIIVIGASYGNGAVPFNDGLTSPLFGIFVNGGYYLDWGQSLIRNRFTVINEAQAGATTFERLGCNPGPQCGPGKWDSYDTQLDRALLRVARRGGRYNSKYVLITFANDCIHSDSAGVPQSDAQQCTLQQLDNVVTRFVAVGQKVIDKGLTPIFVGMPAYCDLDLQGFGAAFGLNWVISEGSYTHLKNNHKFRIKSELPGALYVDAWSTFTPLADGIHPDQSSMEKATYRLIFELLVHSYTN